MENSQHSSRNAIRSANVFDPGNNSRPDPALLKYYGLAAMLSGPAFPFVFRGARHVDGGVGRIFSTGDLLVHEDVRVGMQPPYTLRADTYRKKSDRAIGRVASITLSRTFVDQERRKKFLHTVSVLPEEATATNSLRDIYAMKDVDPDRVSDNITLFAREDATLRLFRSLLS